MEKFETLKQELLDKAREKNACSSEYKRAYGSENEEQLLKVIYDNLSWCSEHKIISAEYFSHFKQDLLIKSGIANTGENNTGFANAGNRNAGYANAGNDNAGAFNSLQQPYMIFNKPSSWKYEDFINSQVGRLLNNISTTLWVPSGNMSEQEKKDHPYHITTTGYIKNIPFKEAFANAWGNWTIESKESFKALPNFDAEVFFEITGVKI